MTRYLFLLFLIVLAACEPAATTLPTRARLATETDIPPAPEVGQSVFAPTATATDTPPATATPSETRETAEPPLSGTPSATITPTITYTPSSTITTTPTQTYTPAPTIGPDERPLVGLAFTALAATVLPTDYVVPGFEGTDIAPQTTTPGAAVIGSVGSATQPANSNCPQNPSGGFGAVYQANPNLAAQLGCPLSDSPQQIPAARQPFERGAMIWLNGEIAVLFDLNSSLGRYDDTFTEGVDPETSSETPPAGYFAPVRGFLKIWGNQPSVRNGLGWATAAEQGLTATVLNFENGRMIWLAGTDEILVLFNAPTNTWRSFPGTY